MEKGEGHQKCNSNRCGPRRHMLAGAALIYSLLAGRRDDDLKAAKRAAEDGPKARRHDGIAPI